MAFTETEKATLTEILGITYSALDTHLDYVVLTTEIEDAIQADILYWNANLRNVADVNIHPTESNKGAELNGGANRLTIMQRIANWLELDLSFGGSSWARTERS
jgi:hypothetical protein